MMEDEKVLWTYFLFLQKHHLRLTLADHLLVVQTASVEHQTTMPCVHASKAMSVLHRHVVQSVLWVPNVHRPVPVLIRSVLTHAWVHVVLELDAKWSTTVPFAVVVKARLETLSRVALTFHVS